MLTWKRVFLAILCSIVLALLFTSFILPGIIIGKAKSWVAEETQRSLDIGTLSINPFSLSVEINNVKLTEPDRSTTFVSWETLRVSLSIASLYHRAPIIDQLLLDKPNIQLERLTDNTFNFSDLIPPTESETPEPESSEPFRFSLNNLSINNGEISLIDSSLEEPVQHVISELQLVLPSLGNLPYMVENPAQPLLLAVVNDAPFKVEGKLKPFTKTQEMQFDLVLDNIDLPHYLGYVPTLPVELRNGKLNLDLDIIYRLSADAGGELVINGRIDLASLDIWDRLGEQLFFMPLLQVEIAPSQPLQKDIHLAALRVYNLEVQLNRDEKGRWNHARMATGKTEESAEADPGETSSPLKLLVDTAEIRDGVIFFRDNLPEKNFATVAREINIDLENFSLDASTGIPVSLTLETERAEMLAVNGNFLLTPFTLELHTEIKNLDASAYEPYYIDIYSVPLGGKLDALINLSIDPENPLLITDSAISWRDAYMAFNEREGMGVELVELQGLNFDLTKNRLEIATYHGDNGKVSFSRNRDANWSFFSANFPILEKLAEAPESPQPAKQEEEGAKFGYRIGELAFNNWQFDILDSQPSTPVNLQARNFNLTFKNLAAPEAVQSPFDFATDFGRRGKVSLQGTLSLARQTMNLKGLIKRIALATFAPYVAEETNLVLANGFFNANIEAKLAGTDPLDLRFSGKVGISRLHLLDGTHREDLLKWDSFQIAGIEGAYEPLDLTIGSITLSDYFAKVLIDEDARLNLVEAFRKAPAQNAVEDEPEDEATVADTAREDVTTAATEPEAAPEETTVTSKIKIDKVVLQGGQVDFTDRNLPRPFHADMRELGGRIDGLSSDPEARAEVDLRGSLRNQSPLDISGTINPLAEELYLDIELGFHDIEMTPFSPYTGNYVGYLIEKGKLNLALDYVIEENQLKASNKVFLDQFDFGAPVESKDAISLPVKLAVALLKDGNGEIHLDIPVYGSLDDPQFSIAGVVWTVIKNLLIKAATSPFALLGAMLGGGEEDFRNISFDYGSARLNDSGKDKLHKMAGALLDRPSLDVEISGFIDPGKDPEGYRQEQLANKIKRLKYLELAKEDELPEGTEEADVIVPAEEYPDYLWDVYKDEGFPKPRNFIGMTKKLPEAEMEKLIYANTEVSDDDLAKLAQQRALAVQNFLIEEGQLPRERIFLKEPDISAAPEEDTVYRARVELGASVK